MNILIKQAYKCDFFECPFFDFVFWRNMVCGKMDFPNSWFYISSIEYQVERPLTNVNTLRKSVGGLYYDFGSVCFLWFLYFKLHHNELYPQISKIEIFYFFHILEVKLIPQT